MDGNTKIGGTTETRSPIGEIKVVVNFEIGGLRELEELTVALSRFREKGLTVMASCLKP